MTVVILTHEGAGTPHLDHLLCSNHQADVYVHTSTKANTAEDKLLRWRNCDREIRQWWTTHRHLIKEQYVTFVEYDVLVNDDLTILETGYDLLGKSFKVDGVDTYWQWFSESNKLPFPAYGIVPLAVIKLSSKALDTLALPEFDSIYDENIFCELRLPSVLMSKKCSVGESVHLSGLHSYRVTHPGDRKGIWHKVL